MSILVVPCWGESYFRTFKVVVPPQMFQSCYLLPLLTLPIQGAKFLDMSTYIKIPDVSYEAPTHLSCGHQMFVDFRVPNIE